MNEPSRSTQRKVQQRVREFLDAVDSALASANVPPDERQGVLADLRAQIAEMLASRAGDAPTLADVDAVLAEIDPPQAYAGPIADTGSRRKPARHSNLVAALRQVCSAWRHQQAYSPARFAQDAQDALHYSEQEARHYNHEYLGTEHVLLGLVREEHGAAGKALRQLGVDLDRLRTELHTMIAPGFDPVAPGHLPHTTRMQWAFAAAADKARQSRGGPARTEDLLFGLLSVPEGIACRVLTERFGLAPDAILRQADRKWA